MPHSDLGQFAQAEDVQEAENVHLFAFELVPVAALLQRQRSRVAVLPEHDQKHVGVGTGGCKTITILTLFDFISCISEFKL